PSLIANNEGLRVKGINGDEVIIDGKRSEILIPNVKADASGFVAVNKNYVDSRVNDVANRLGSVIDANNKNLQAGIAGALAAAGLPMSSMPGKSVFALSAGTYKGKSAVALGFSSVSDNGKTIFRIHGNSNSVGDFGGSVGVGWAW
ncbi:adhesin, partial [Campylobacter sp. FMV-PI01]